MGKRGSGFIVSVIAEFSLIFSFDRLTYTRLMTRLARRYPHYGWHSNAGYGSALHRDAMASVGVTAHHRQSFAPLRNWLEDPEKAHNVVRAMNA